MQIDSSHQKTIGEVQKILFRTFVKCIQDKKPMRSYMLWGSPGIGKTWAMKWLASALRDHLKVEVKDRVFLTSVYEPFDIGGVLFEDKETHKYCKYLPPQWAYEASIECETFSGPMLLCFDDIVAAQESTMNALFKVVDERMVGDLPFRDNVMLMAAGNYIEDNAGASEMNTALANRFRHLWVKVDHKEWILWAISYGIQSLISGFINKTPSLLHKFNPASAEKAFPTPRSWHNVSDLLSEVISVDPLTWANEILNLESEIIGIVGRDAGLMFTTYSQGIVGVLSPEEIISSPKTVKIPTSLDAQYISTVNLIQYLEMSKDILHKGFDPTLQFISRDDLIMDLGVSVALQTMKLAVKDDKLGTEFMDSPGWADFSNRFGRYLTLPQIVNAH